MAGTHGSPRHESLTTAPGAPAILPRGDYLTNEVLPAAGAFTSDANQIAIPVGAKRITFWVKYTQGAAGGFPVFRFFDSFQAPPTVGENFRNPVLDLGSFSSAGAEGTTKFYLEDLEGPPPDAVTNRYKLTFELDAQTRSAGVQVAEAGVPATPGTVNVVYTID